MMSILRKLILLAFLSLSILYKQAPFKTAFLQSNALLTDPPPIASVQGQFTTFCLALGLDPDATDIKQTLQDPEKLPTETIMRVMEEGKLGKQ